MTPRIKKLLAKFDGVTLMKTARIRKTGLDTKQLEDVAAGRVSKYNSAEDFFKEPD